MSWFPSFSFTGNLDNRLPTVSAGLSLTIIVFLILTGQVGLYFWKTPIHSRDPLWIKGIVISIWMMQASAVVLVGHMSSLAHSSDPTTGKVMVEEFLWEWAAYTGTSAIMGCLVHAFFVNRIYLLETNPVHARIFMMMLCIILILEGSFAFVTVLYFLIPSLRSPALIITWPVPIWLGLSILADISIAGSLCHILNKGSPFVSKSLSLLVKRLTEFCIKTGLITGLAAGITVVLWIAAQLDSGHLFMSFPMGGIYAACFMTNLIARESYFCHTLVDKEDECLGMATRSIVFATPECSGKDESLSSKVN